MITLRSPYTADDKENVSFQELKSQFCHKKSCAKFKKIRSARYLMKFTILSFSKRMPHNAIFVSLTKDRTFFFIISSSPQSPQRFQFHSASAEQSRRFLLAQERKKKSMEAVCISPRTALMRLRSRMPGIC